MGEVNRIDHAEKLRRGLWQAHQYPAKAGGDVSIVKGGILDFDKGLTIEKMGK